MHADTLISPDINHGATPDISSNTVSNGAHAASASGTIPPAPSSSSISAPTTDHPDCADCPHLQCGGKNIALVKRLADKLITEEEAYFVSELFKALSDMTRVRILFALLGGEMCVCDLQELVGVTQSAVSHQLRTLKQAGLVKYRREGKSLYYSIADGHVSTMLATGLEHISE